MVSKNNGFNSEKTMRFKIKNTQNKMFFSFFKNLGTKKYKFIQTGMHKVTTKQMV